MQTFLPLPSFTESAKVLDWKRLGKQRVETLQILNALLYGSKWETHPATKMWKGYAYSLASYGIVICNEWIRRGYRDGCRTQLIIRQQTISSPQELILPPWWGGEAFHSSHRAILLGKDEEWYSQFGWKENPAVQDSKGRWPYVWPV